MKIACLQFAPELGAVAKNTARANELLDEAAANGSTIGLDWLVLPELALTGYNFPSLSAITPHLEPTAAGPSTLWAQQTAARLRCHVTIGYPETTASASASNPGTRYNSTVTVSPTGAVLANYRKTHLYYTDETWASEGDSRFFAGALGALGNVSLGICMDINPHRFLAPWTQYEFARHCLAARTNVVCLSMAWLTRQSAADIAASPAAPDAETLAYWLERFEPVREAGLGVGVAQSVALQQSGSGAGGEDKQPSAHHQQPGSSQPIDDAHAHQTLDTPGSVPVPVPATQPTYLILANRSGSEGGVSYAGTSAVLRLEGGSVQIYDILGKGEEGVLVVDLGEAPKYAVTMSTPAS